MFKNKTDRLNYGNLLMPPLGYELTKAVATTYSLDLETLTAATIALGLQEDTDSVVAETPVALLHALQKVTDKVVVFCESGQTKIPNTSSPLVLLLEKMVIPVALIGQNGSYPSFHPKTWTLEYESPEGDKLYRFIVLSRNLTFDRSWDVSFMMEGKKQTGGVRHVKPLIAFLEYLENWISPECENSLHQQTIVDSLKDELRDVRFELERKEFGDFTIMPIGIGKDGADMREDNLFRGYPDPQQSFTFQELTVMSPFLSTETIEYLNSDRHTLTGTRRKLFTRRTELPKIKDVAGNFDVYVLKDTIIDGEEALPEGEEMETKHQDIHAKMYLLRKYSDNHLYLGSMNASTSGINRNVEMMIKLEIKNQQINMDKLCEDFFAGAEDNKYNPFERVDLQSLPDETPDEGEDKELEEILKRLCRCKSSCIIEQEDDVYTMHVHFDMNEIPTNVDIRPLRVNNSKPIDSNIVFGGLDILRLSEFFVLTINGKESNLNRVIMIHTTGIPEERDKLLVKDIIKDKKTFIEYVSMALGDDLLSLFGSEQEEHQNENDKRQHQNIKMPALYEKMLRVAYEDKRRLLEIEPIMNMIEDKNIIDSDFRDTYEMFKKAMKI